MIIARRVICYPCVLPQHAVRCSAWSTTAVLVVGRRVARRVARSVPRSQAPSSRAVLREIRAQFVLWRIAIGCRWRAGRGAGHIVLRSGAAEPARSPGAAETTPFVP